MGDEAQNEHLIHRLSSERRAALSWCYANYPTVSGSSWRCRSRALSGIAALQGASLVVVELVDVLGRVRQQSVLTAPLCKVELIWCEAGSAGADRFVIGCRQRVTTGVV
jgi:hypothetical protein